ncbi:cholesterol 7-desaturase nvd-like [Branchiostoma floridae x Branchiostoma japonicum]
MFRVRHLFAVLLAVLASVVGLKHGPTRVDAAWVLLRGETLLAFQWPSVEILLLFAIGLAGAIWLYQVLFSPMEFCRELGDLGYHPDGTRNMKAMANDARRRRQRGHLPPVYPNGWWGILESRLLQRGQVKEVVALGEHLAVFRQENGTVSVVDAYCPHLGANLGVGGRVVGNCIECPFHGWRYRGEDGKCMHIPYAAKVPDVARVKSWTCLECNGSIYIWYHCDGEEPSWTPKLVDEVESGEWTCRGLSEHFINAHVEEISENGADIGHLNHLHGPGITTGNDLRHIWSSFTGFFTHQWEADWQPFPAPDTQFGTMTVDMDMYLFGYRIPLPSVKARAIQNGPGVVYLYIDGPLMHVVLVSSITPVEPLLLRYTQSIYASRGTPTFLAKIVQWGEAVQLERDVTVWNNKSYPAKPVLVKEDAAIVRHRRWYSQFYSKNSPRFTTQRTSLDW